jgi:hypothetical protein
VHVHSIDAQHRRWDGAADGADTADNCTTDVASNLWANDLYRC